MHAFVNRVYADQGSSRTVVKHLDELFVRFSDSDLMLDIGGGLPRVHPLIKNLNLEPGDGVDIVGNVLDLPFESDSVGLVVCQEVLEHVSHPFLAMQEIHRVIRPGGVAFVQLPFVLGDHPCPDDFWRFTRQGIVELAQQAGFSDVKHQVTVGPANGFYRVGVEFFAILLSLPVPRLYRHAKGAAALFLYPLKWLDRLMNRHPQAHRVAGGFFIVATKGEPAAAAAE